MRVKYPILDPKRHVTELGIVDKLWIDPRLGLASGFWRLNGLNAGAAVTGRKNVGQQEDCTFKKIEAFERGTMSFTLTTFSLHIILPRHRKVSFALI